jgi:hypothetical protein
MIYTGTKWLKEKVVFREERPDPWNGYKQGSYFFILFPAAQRIQVGNFILLISSFSEFFTANPER